MISTLYDKFKPWSDGGSIYLVSDTHFEDKDTHLMNPAWITPQEHMAKLKEHIHKNDTLIHLGDVGKADYLDELKCHKVLLSGNHDVLSKVAPHFDEVFNGPLFIADRILLSHEPIYGLENFCLNIHGHCHNGAFVTYNENNCVTHLNLAADVVNFEVYDLKSIIKQGYLSNISNYHRITIERAKEKPIAKSI